MLLRSGRLAAAIVIFAMSTLSIGPAVAADPAAAAAPAAPAPAPAAAPVAPIIVIIDFDRIMQESKAGKSIQGQMQQRVATYQKTFAQQESDLNNSRQELARLQSTLGQEAFEAKVKDFQARVADTQQKAQQAEASLSQGQGQAIQKVREETRRILADVMKERGANIVIAAAAAPLFDPRFDVTETVMGRLDNRLPSVTVDFTAPAAAAATDKSAGAQKK